MHDPAGSDMGRADEIRQEPKATSFGEVRRPIAVDLFSGAGGLSLGFEMAGFDVVSAVEYDPVHAATHLYNFPLTDVICGDVSTVDAERIRRSARDGWLRHNPGCDPSDWDGTIDALIGGPSCQGFSVMGKQDVADNRNQLVLEFVRLVEELRPRTFCMENVPGFLDPKFSQLRLTALGRLKAAGYAISGDDTVHRAEAFGVPQRRRRVFIMGVLEGEPAPLPVMVTPSREFTVSQAFIGLPAVSSVGARIVDDVLKLSDDERSTLLEVHNEYIDHIDAHGSNRGHLGHPREYDPARLTGFRRTVHKSESVTRFQSTPQGSVEKTSRAYRLSGDRASNTLRAGTGRERGAFSASRPLHPTEPRVITVREAARLHGFPDWFRFHSTNWHGHRQIGNAVPPPLARAAAEVLVSVLALSPQRSNLDPLKLGQESLVGLTPTAASEHFSVPTDQVPRRVRPHMEVNHLIVATGRGEAAQHSRNETEDLRDAQILTTARGDTDV
jgi:DNA (cytosine-5)-methyltransferase 1